MPAVMVHHHHVVALKTGCVVIAGCVQSLEQYTFELTTSFVSRVTPCTL